MRHVARRTGGEVTGVTTVSVAGCQCVCSGVGLRDGTVDPRGSPASEPAVEAGNRPAGVGGVSLVSGRIEERTVAA